MLKSWNGRLNFPGTNGRSFSIPSSANGKYNTRYYSEMACKADKADKRHDHVYTRKRMIERILANSDDLEGEVQLAIGCVVTKAEHDELTKYDKEWDGWK